MTTTTMEPVSTKLKPSEKKAFLKTCDYIGTSPSNAIRMFVSAFNKCGGFPFDTSNPLGLSTTTLKAINDANTGDTIGPFSNMDDFKRALESD